MKRVAASSVGRPERPSALPQPRDRVRRGLHPSGVDLPVAQGEHLEQRRRLPGLLETVDVLRDRLGPSVPVRRWFINGPGHKDGPCRIRR